MKESEIDQHSVLFVTLSNVGDAVMTTPALQTLHSIYPGSSVDIVVDKRSRELFEYCPYRGEIFEKNKKDFLRGLPKLVMHLRRKNYGLVVDLRTELLTWLIRADRKLCKRDRNPAAIHSVEQHLSVIRSIAKGREVENCCIWPSEEDKRFARNTIGQPGPGKILSIAPGANATKKIWDWQNYRELISKLNTQFGTVLLMGNAKDSVIAEEISKTLPFPAFNLCGKTTLLQAAAILQKATLFIGNDSGLGHMAAAAGVPTCTLFGPGEPEKYRPWGKNAVWIVGDNRQINAITVSHVIGLLEQHSLLSRDRLITP